jgi:hypothetical protein
MYRCFALIMSVFISCNSKEQQLKEAKMEYEIIQRRIKFNAEEWQIHNRRKKTNSGLSNLPNTITAKLENERLADSLLRVNDSLQLLTLDLIKKIKNLTTN